MLHICIVHTSLVTDVLEEVERLQQMGTAGESEQRGGSFERQELKLRVFQTAAEKRSCSDGQCEDSDVLSDC